MTPHHGTPSASAEKTAQHFKRSPTLLFDILAESDKDRQQRKLQQATLSPADQRQQHQQRHSPGGESPRPPSPGHPQGPHPAQPQPVPATQQPPLEESSKRVSAPATPDLPVPMPPLPQRGAAAVGGGAVGGRAAGGGPSGPDQPEPAKAAAGSHSSGSAVRTGVVKSDDEGREDVELTEVTEEEVISAGQKVGMGLRQPLRPHQQPQAHQPLELPQQCRIRHQQVSAGPDDEAAAAATTTTAAAVVAAVAGLRGLGASPGPGDGDGGGVDVEDASDADVVATTAEGCSGGGPGGGKAAQSESTLSTCPPAGSQGQPGAPHVEAPAPPRDLLAEFTPRVILQELLGELFIPPERLTRQGTFGQGAFATVQSCGMEMGPGGPSLLVAVKSLKPQVLSDLEDLRRFLLEANLVRKLHHPNIVSIHGLGAHDLTSLEALRGSAYVVMEALEGGDLRMMVLKQMTSHSPAYSRLDALRWCVHIAAACAYLHETCRPMIIHRDLKLENVMLTGGPIDGRVAKITDFGLHKRARYSRTEDVLIAVTNEWSTRGGSVYRQDGPGAGAGPGAGGGGGGPLAGGTVRGGSARADCSTYGGSVVEASYYGGNMFYDNSCRWSSTAGGAAGGGDNANGSVRPGGGNRSASAKYMALATAGLAAATAEPTAAATTAAAPAAAVSGLTHRATPNKTIISSAATVGGADVRVCADGFTEVMGLGASVGSPPLDGGGSTGEAPGSLPLGDSVRAGSGAATELGIVTSQGKAVTDRERPYLLAYDKRYDTPPNGGSKWSSTTDLVGLNDAAAEAAAAAAAVLTQAAEAAEGSGGDPSSPPMPAVASSLPAASATSPHRQTRQQQQPTGWAPPNVVPPASPTLEESVHRKMLALMALESAAAAPTGPGLAATATATSPMPNAGGAGGTASTAPAEAPFSVTEFVRAAAAAAAAEVGGAAAAATAPGSGPSAVVLMRSMSLALQQQKEQRGQQQQQPQPPNGTSPSFVFSAVGASMPPPSAASVRAAARAAAMKTVPEDNRMSMDVGSGGATPRTAAAAAAGKSSLSAAAAAAAAASAEASSSSASRSPSGALSLPTTSAGRRHVEAVHRREKVASAAARMADATRQVGSLIYMAPELVVSGNYNEKVDVFSFSIIAYELFTGKLLAMKVANEYAYQLEQQGSAAGGAAAAARAGPGGLPAAGTRSAEADAEAGVMSYVMRRCGGAREPLPSWWPSELRALIAACWAQEPAKRPSFSQIHRELRRMQHAGTLADMDSKDPLRNTGCGCVVS